MTQWWHRSWAVAVSGALVATVAVLCLAHCKTVERNAWQRVSERAKAIAAPFARGVEPHAPLLGTPQPGLADRHYAAAGDALSSIWSTHEDPDDLDPFKLDDVLAMADLPAGTGKGLTRYSRVLAALAAGAAADQIYYGAFRDGLVRQPDPTRLPMPIGGGTVGVAVLLAARVDLAAGNHAAAVQRAADVLTLARDQLRTACSVYDLLGVAFVNGVSELWTDVGLASTPPAELRRLADVLLRFDMMCGPASQCGAGDAPWIVASSELGVPGLGVSRLASPEQLDAYMTAIESLPEDTAPWSARKAALEKAVACLPAKCCGDLPYIEHRRRVAIARVRLLRMAIAHRLGEQVPVLLDPFSEAPLQATAHEGGMRFASSGTDVDDKPIERIVRAR